jgi:hypothetical protein
MVSMSCVIPLACLYLEVYSHWLCMTNITAITVCALPHSTADTYYFSACRMYRGTLYTHIYVFWGVWIIIYPSD